ncbi:hypothetical protein Tco_0265692 [Tanacetum coccineum]
MNIVRSLMILTAVEAVTTCYIDEKAVPTTSTEVERKRKEEVEGGNSKGSRQEDACRGERAEERQHEKLLKRKQKTLKSKQRMASSKDTLQYDKEMLRRIRIETDLRRYLENSAGKVCGEYKKPEMNLKESLYGYHVKVMFNQQ